MVNLSKTAISVVISFLVVTLMFSSFSWFEAFAARKDPNWGKKGNVKIMKIQAKRDVAGQWGR